MVQEDSFLERTLRQATHATTLRVVGCLQPSFSHRSLTRSISGFTPVDMTSDLHTFLDTVSFVWKIDIVDTRC